MSKYANIEQIKKVIREEWTKYMPSDLDINLSFVLGKISEVPTIDIVHCLECTHRGDDWWCYKHEFTPIPIEDYFCKDGERKDNE